MDVGFGFKTGKAQNEQMLSGLPPIADMRDGVPDFRLVPEADSCTATKPFARVSLLDHLVRGGEQRRRYGQAAATGDCRLP